jgi:hypothetical protein
MRSRLAATTGHAGTALSYRSSSDDRDEGEPRSPGSTMFWVKDHERQILD